MIYLTYLVFEPSKVETIYFFMRLKWVLLVSTTYSDFRNWYLHGVRKVQIKSLKRFLERSTASLREFFVDIDDELLPNVRKVISNHVNNLQCALCKNDMSGVFSYRLKKRHVNLDHIGGGDSATILAPFLTKIDTLPDSKVFTNEQDILLVRGILEHGKMEKMWNKSKKLQLFTL